MVIDAHDDLADALRAAAGQPEGREARARFEALARAYRSWALAQLTAWALAHDPDIGPATALQAVLTWSRLHGLVSLEIAGNFASMGIDPDQLFEAQLSTLTA